MVVVCTLRLEGGYIEVDVERSILVSQGVILRLQEFNHSICKLSLHRE